MQAAVYLLASLFTIGGLLAFSAGIANWDWFFRSPNVKVLTGRIRRSRARIIYVLLGSAIIAMGCYMFMSV